MSRCILRGNLRFTVSCFQFQVLDIMWYNLAAVHLHYGTHKTFIIATKVDPADF